MAVDIVRQLPTQHTEADVVLGVFVTGTERTAKHESHRAKK